MDIINRQLNRQHERSQTEFSEILKVDDVARMTFRGFLICTLAVTTCACGDPVRSCSSRDFQCNYDMYKKEIRQYPPNFYRAIKIASFDNKNMKILNDVIKEDDDYIASSLLRISNYMSYDQRMVICSNKSIIKSLRERGSKIKNLGQRQEYSTVFYHTCNNMEITVTGELR